MSLFLHTCSRPLLSTVTLFHLFAAWVCATDWYHPLLLMSVNSEVQGTGRFRALWPYLGTRRVQVVLTLVILNGIFLLSIRGTTGWLNFWKVRTTGKLPMNSNRYLLNVEDMDILNDESIAQDDPRLVALVRRMLIPPSTEPYNFSRKELGDPRLNIDPSGGQSQAVKDILAGFGPDGLFLDCGANDGEWWTNTLWVERNLGWKGLLIEADPRPFANLLKKHRKAYLGNFCLSTTPHPQIVPFYIDDWNIGIGSGLIYSKIYRSTKAIPVQCLPLYTVMLAMGRTTIDFFSLDVEGSEIEILRTLPEDAVIKVITIEHSVLKEGKLGLRKFMEDRGYIFYRTVADPRFIAGDSVFVHKSVKLTKEQLAIVGTDNDTYKRATRT